MGFRFKIIWRLWIGYIIYILLYILYIIFVNTLYIITTHI